MFKRVAGLSVGVMVMLGFNGGMAPPVQADAFPATYSLHVRVETPPMSGEVSPPPITTSVSVYTMGGASLNESRAEDVPELAAGRYLVKAGAIPLSDAGTSLSDAWYGDTPYRSRSTPVEITDHDVTITINLVNGGVISGHVTAPGGGIVAGGSAAAFLYDPIDGSYELAGSSQTDASGAYSIHVPPGAFVVRGGQDPLNAGYVIPDYADRLYGDGTVVEVSGDERVNGIDVELPPWSTTTERIAGDDRFDTAVTASEAAFSVGVPVVYIANGLNWPDALSAGPAAAHEGGPLLLTAPSSIPAVLDGELRRLQPQRIVVVGGPAAVSDQVLTQLMAYAPSVSRIGGTDRFEVSRAVSTEVFGSRVQSRTMLVATGANFPDALSAGALGARLDAPVVLINTGGDRIDDVTRSFLFSASLVGLSAVGGPAVISDDYVDQLGYFTKWGGAGRYGGADRFAVNRVLNGGDGGAYPSVEWQQTAYLVSARNYPDAMSATTLAASQNARVYLSEPTCVPRQTLDLMRGSHINKIVLIGGPAALSDDVARLQPC